MEMYKDILIENVSIGYNNPFPGLIYNSNKKNVLVKSLETESFDFYITPGSNFANKALIHATHIFYKTKNNKEIVKKLSKKELKFMKRMQHYFK